MYGHFLKLHFNMFERSQGKHNSLDCNNCFGILSINYKVYMFKAWQKSKMYLHVQSTQTLKMESPYFFSNIFFFYRMFIIPFENWRGF
jgi:hypothetical protein